MGCVFLGLARVSMWACSDTDTDTNTDTGAYIHLRNAILIGTSSIFSEVVFYFRVANSVGD